MSNIYADLLEKLKTNDKVAMITVFGETIEKKLVTDDAFFEDAPEIVKRAFAEGKPIAEKVESGNILVEPFCKDERMIILGGGHVSLALAEFASKIGFSVMVVDDRPGFSNKARFPFASETICDSFEHAIPLLGINGMDYVVLVTRGHKHDGDCLRALSKETATKYLGMIGSRRRVAGLKDVLEEEGISRAWLDSIYTPIGLNIGAVTPEEIGISILAEIIQVKRQPKKDENAVLHSDVEMEVIEKLAIVPDKRKNVKKAVVTIIETKGSAPRKAGAKMIVYEDGMIEGTVGGGCAEANLMGIARGVIKTGGYRIEKVDLTNEVAGEEGMVCGGTMTMLIEAVPEEG